jgi:hypothetical protein
MSNSPIEFMGEEPGHDVPLSEYGGDDGLIQPEQGAVLLGAPVASGGHMLKGDDRQMISEKNNIMMRAASEPLPPSEGKSGIPDNPGIIDDPETGRRLPSDASVAVDPADPAGSTAVSDLKDSLGGQEIAF